MEIRKDLPEIFEDFSEARRNGFISAKQFKDQNKPMIGTFCTYMPQELPLAMGAAVVSLCATSDETIAEAEVDLPRNLCPLIKSSYGFGKTDKCPYFYFSDLVVGETTCDGKKKMYEMLNELKHTHVMQLPPGKTGAMALEAWHGEMYRLKDVLEEQLGVEITKEDIKEAIKLKNRERKAMLDFFEIGKLKPTPLSGYEINTVVDSSTFTFDIEERIKDIEERTAELKREYELNFKGKPSRPRVLITGCPTGGVREKVIRQIEELGADIVGFENCCGPREKKDPVDESKDPMLALAEKYLRVNCSVMSPNPGRIEAMNEMIDDYKVDGVIEVVLQACHTFAIESDRVKNFVTKEKKIPYMCLDTDYSQSDSGQINTRVSAFIEMMQ